jgi:hypothetical protein
MAGRLNKQIAAELGTAEKTVKAQRARGMSKMKVRSVAELVRVVERAHCRSRVSWLTSDGIGAVHALYAQGPIGSRASAA